MMAERPKIGLALGSGGAKGLAHIGVLQVLKENKIPIDFIAGSSIGAVIGGFYAAGFSPQKIERIFLEIDRRQIFSLLFDPHLKQGLISGRKLEKFLENHLGSRKIEELQIPFAAIATDLKTGNPIIFRKGKLSAAMRASIAIPLIFKPVFWGNKILVDGGISMPVPVRPLREMGAEIVLAVNLDNYHYNQNSNFGLYNIANSSLDILRYHLASANIKDADVVINIKFENDILFYEFKETKEKILVGRKESEAVLPQIQKLLKNFN